MTKILVVDDEWELAESLQLLLELEGYEVVTAGDGREALTAVAQEPPDLIVSDLMMPKMDGLELARALRADPSWATVPIILMSAGIVELQPDLWNAFLPKPFHLDRVLHTIQDVLGDRPSTDEPASAGSPGR